MKPLLEQQARNLIAKWGGNLDAANALGIPESEIWNALPADGRTKPQWHAANKKLAHRIPSESQNLKGRQYGQH
ncbi:MAG: hypothetical protein JJ979_24155 [Roseibium sp.]|nr:hypothetical protein [Roseibium sp.]